MYSVYVLRSLKDNRLYVGMTSDVVARVRRHNQGGVRSTRYRRPLVLVHQEPCSSREDARAREKFLKSGPGHEYLKSVVQL